MTDVREVSATLEVAVWINGYRVESEDVAASTQRLINAAEAVLPQWYQDDTREQSQIRRAIEMLRALKAFE